MIENLSFAYGRLEALRGISARAEEGTITAVVGPNAAGKSTLLRCIIGALRPNAGKVCINGKRVDTLSPRLVAQHLAYVPQRSFVSAAFTVRQVVELGRYALAPNQGQVREAIKALDLDAIANRSYAQLSVGQQQRVTLARALAQLSPSGHLIVDEPISAMDLRHSHLCMAVFRALAAGGATVIMALHDLSMAADLAHNAWLLDRGQLVNAGPACEVLKPEQLQAVFGVRFEWVNTHAGAPILASPYTKRAS